MNRTNNANVTQSWKSTTALNVHTTVSPWTTTSQLPILSTCKQSPMLPPVIPENNKNYIENSCVVILRFGPWVEKVCLEQKPFICYEDRFMGRVNVSNITSSSVSLQWDQGPGDLSHYRLQVAAADWNLTVELHNLNFELNNLTAGTRYNIQVFPVKCKRDLNPQNVSFYTIPGVVENLTVTSFTETSVSLSWKKPDGNYDFFQVTANSLLEQADPIIRDNITTEHLVFDKLIQGNNYTFVFITGVEDRTMWSQERKTWACTRPGKVTKLEAFDNSDTWLKVRWTPPVGKYMEFTVKVKDGNMSDLNATVTLLDSSKLNEVKLSGLSKGSMIKLFVRVLSVCSLQGENENITTYTGPSRPTNARVLNSTINSLTFVWEPPVNSSATDYNCTLTSTFWNTFKANPVSDTICYFENLSSGRNYSFQVYTLSDNKTRWTEERDVWVSLMDLSAPQPDPYKRKRMDGGYR
ncbi:hypothetical protein CRENBAI_026668 [Crenichthys baileyi]|uniref:Fibronectin type-III domain-containing protein n=1 Tax=Crenichthys baileyi TaxID=28760 RepID=A0AAV9R0W5_9TELE